MAITRGACTLYRVLKELATKKLARDRLAFLAVSVELFPVVSGAWRARSEQLIHAVGQGTGSAPLGMLVKYLAKCLYQVMVSAFPTSLQPAAAGIAPNDVAALFSALLEHQQALLTAYCAGAGAGQPLGGVLAKVLRRMTLIVVDCQRTFPLPFRAFLGPFLGAFHDQLTTLYGPLPLPPGPSVAAAYPATPATNPGGLEKFASNALAFVTNVAGCSEYRLDLAAHHTTTGSHRALSAAGDQEMSRLAIAEAASVVGSFFTSERCQALLDLCLRALLPWRTADLEAWKVRAYRRHRRRN
jgi:hypothetical protein